MSTFTSISLRAIALKPRLTVADQPCPERRAELEPDAARRERRPDGGRSQQQPVEHVTFLRGHRPRSISLEGRGLQSDPPAIRPPWRRLGYARLRATEGTAQSGVYRGRWIVALMAMVIATLGLRRPMRPLRPGAVRALVPGPERGALLPDHQQGGAGSHLRRGSAGRRRDPPGSGERAVSDHRHAARLGRQQDQLRVELPGGRIQQQQLRPPGIRRRQLHSSWIRRLLWRGSHPRTTPAPAARATSISGDTRYEARDTQHLLGLLADQGIVKPSRIGVTGVSYGGGQSMELAFLRDRIRRRDGELTPWRSPREGPQDRGRVPALALVRPRRRADPQRPLPRHPGRAAGAEPDPRWRSNPELHQRPLCPRLGYRLLLRDGAGLHPLHRPRRQYPPGLRRGPGRQAALRRRHWPPFAASTTTTAPTAWRSWRAPRGRHPC